MKQNKVQIGLLGLGTVGQGVIDLFRNYQLNPSNYDLPAQFNIKSACVRNLKQKRDCDLSNIELTDDWRKIVEDPQIDIIIEVMGSSNDDSYLATQKALQLNKIIISANKALLCNKGYELFTLSQKSKGFILFEAACAGAIAIVRSLRLALVSEKVEKMVGILNGTSNFILSKMSTQKSNFATILKQAQDLGYAEADPTFDIEGLDAAHKLVLLAKLAFKQNSDCIYYQGISHIENIDVEYADYFKYVIKHLAIAQLTKDKKLNLRVHSALVKKDNLIARVNNNMNAVLINTQFSGEHFFYGAGAGRKETASAIMADLFEALIALNQQTKPYRSQLDFNKTVEIKKIELMDEAIDCSYYLRLSVLDKAGILAKITQFLSEQKISVDAIHQDLKTNKQNQKIKDIVLITHKCQQSSILYCLQYFVKLCIGKPIMLRVY